MSYVGATVEIWERPVGAGASWEVFLSKVALSLKPGMGWVGRNSAKDSQLGNNHMYLYEDSHSAICSYRLRAQAQ